MAMSLEELRNKNKRLTLERALGLFLSQGVEQTTFRDIARAAGLTDRSVYRYYENKAELVLDSTFLFWDLFSAQAEKIRARDYRPEMTGLEQIRLVLLAYVELYLEHPEYVRYISGAERLLYNEGIPADVRTRPPGRFETTDSPLVRAIRRGLADGSVSRKVDAEMLYYNVYDAIQGMMYRDAIGATDCDIDCARRMESLVEMFVCAFRGTTY